MSSPPEPSKMYIYELPHTERKDLCRVLDQNNRWEELAGTHMQYDVLTIQELRREVYRGNSPTEELLTMWGHQNHKVLELFILLSRMHHYQAMTIIKKFVPSRYHKLISEGEQNLEVLFGHSVALQQNPVVSPKKVQIPPANFDAEEKILNVPAGLPAARAKTPEGRDEHLKYVKVRTPFVIHRRPRQEDKRVPIAVAEVVRHRDENLGAIPRIQISEAAALVSSDENESLPPLEPIPPPIGRTSPRKRAPSLSEINCVVGSAGSIPQISYEELAQATNNWDENSVLGKGGFGTVYRGTWKCTQVAIKRLGEKNDPKSHDIQIQQSITELHCLNAYRHDNVLPIYGYSIGGDHPCLVYQYMPGGCLEHRLRKDPTKILNWVSRLKIAIGTARGLQFLHTIGEKPLIHGDIKPANILLDPNDNPRIGDFGLAREGPDSHYTHIKVSRIHGTRPYLPDEFLRNSTLSTKVDTYSFGIVLFELGTSLSAYSTRREYKYLKDHVVKYEGHIMELKDDQIEGDDFIFRRLIDIGKMCVETRPKDRPEMVQVLVLLEGVPGSGSVSLVSARKS